MIEYNLNIGDLRVSGYNKVVYTCLGLGSCIGLFLQDRTNNLSGAAHIFLPEQSCPDSLDKFYSANRAINQLLWEFRRLGSSLNTLRAKIVGGANILTSGFQTGKQNVESVTKELVKHKVYIAAADVGGNVSRSAWFEGGNGTLKVRISQSHHYRIY